MRSVNMAITAVAVIIGYWFAADVFITIKSIIAAFSAALICGGGNIFNDFYDREIDAVNKPDRPYAAGLLSDRDMISAGTVLFASGIFFSIFIGFYCILLAVFTTIMLFVYNMFAKRTVLLGNLIVSILTGTAFLYGAEAGGDMWSAAVPALFAGVFHLGREIFKDIEDMEGDSRMHAVTFPVRFGIQPAIFLGVVVYCLLILITLYPYMFLGYSGTYFIIVLLGVDCLVIFLVARYLVTRSISRLRQLNSMLKIGMAFGMLALILK